MIEKVIKNSKRIETLLEVKLGASGKGLHEKLSSIDTIIDKKYLKKIRWIATIRNKIVHEDGYILENKEELFNNCDEVIKYLEMHESNYKKNSNSSIHSRLGASSSIRAKNAPYARKTLLPKEDINNTKIVQNKTYVIRYFILYLIIFLGIFSIYQIT